MPFFSLQKTFEPTEISGQSLRSGYHILRCQIWILLYENGMILYLSTKNSCVLQISGSPFFFFISQSSDR